MNLASEKLENSSTELDATFLARHNQAESHARKLAMHHTSLSFEIANCFESEIANSQELSAQQLTTLKTILSIEEFVETPRFTSANVLLFGPIEAQKFHQTFNLPVIARVELPQHKIWLFVFRHLNQKSLSIIFQGESPGAFA